MIDSNVFGVMTSGAATAALLALRPALEAVAACHVVLLSRSVGSGETHISARLRRGEIADIVIVADDLLRQCMAEGLVVPGSRVPLVYSQIGMAVRAGAVVPNIATLEDFTRTLLGANSIAYSASVSGQYLVNELWPRLGVVDVLRPKALCVAHERVGAVVARGEAEIGFEQLSELLPVPGIAHVTPLPEGAQKTTLFSGGVAVLSRAPARARAVLQFLGSVRAHQSIIASGLRPFAY
jgi:molybdate transport system substrate-binding protein